MRSANRVAYLELVACGVIWGSIGVIVKDVRVGAAAIADARMAIGCVAVVAFMAARGKLRELRMTTDRRLLILDGLLLGIHWVLMFEGFKRLSVATAILIVFVGPVFVAAGVGRLLGERVERRTIASLALSVAGMVLITVPAWRVHNAAGLGFALGSAVAFAALMIAGKRLTRTYRPPAILAWQLGIGAVAVAPVALTSNLNGLAAGMPALLTLGIVHTAAAGFLYFAALTVVKAQHVGVLSYVEPGTAIFYAWLFLHEHPGPATLAGGALILLGGVNIVLVRPGSGGSPEEPVAPTGGMQASLRP